MDISIGESAKKILEGLQWNDHLEGVCDTTSWQEMNPEGRLAALALAKLRNSSLFHPLKQTLKGAMEATVVCHSSVHVPHEFLCWLQEGDLRDTPELSEVLSTVKLSVAELRPTDMDEDSYQPVLERPIYLTWPPEPKEDEKKRAVQNIFNHKLPRESEGADSGQPTGQLADVLQDAEEHLMRRPFTATNNTVKPPQKGSEEAPREPSRLSTVLAEAAESLDPEEEKEKERSHLSRMLSQSNQFLRATGAESASDTEAVPPTANGGKTTAPVTGRQADTPSDESAVGTQTSPSAATAEPASQPNQTGVAPPKSRSASASDAESESSEPETSDASSDEAPARPLPKSGLDGRESIPFDYRHKPIPATPQGTRQTGQHSTEQTHSPDPDRPADPASSSGPSGSPAASPARPRDTSSVARPKTSPTGPSDTSVDRSRLKLALLVVAFLAVGGGLAFWKGKTLTKALRLNSK